MKRCPITYEKVDQGQYSAGGLRRLSPRLSRLSPFPYSAAEQRYQAAQQAAKISVQGMQPKLSVKLNVSKGEFQLVEGGALYIVKPQHHIYPQLPENEDLTMKMAHAAGLDVPLHGMVWCADQSLSYFIRRFDRPKRGKKLALEDFAQLTGQTRKTKYEFSMERLVPVLEQYCTFPLLDKLKLFRLTLFSFITGNEDMHLKNFSLITRDGKVQLSPAYDLLNTSIALSGATEETALPLAGRKRKHKRDDWLDYWGRERLGLNLPSIQQVLNDFRQATPRWKQLLEWSFLDAQMKQKYEQLLANRLGRLGLE